jgi:tRNA A-37 threonylcarbamoyl transferase component Bud32/ribosomal protein L40E
VKDDLIGTRIGHYIIQEPLGQGGMARVYKGYQEHLDRLVAIKVLPSYYAADPNFVNRFKREAQAMARLSHPHIVTVHDAGEQDGRLYIVMAYMSGGTLKGRMDHQMELAEALPVVRQIAEALQYAHERSIIHRDVKPVNVLLDGDGRAVLSDFGIAKVMESAEQHLTRPGAGVGTPEYMSPEQCRGSGVSPRSDIYALGVMIYEMLTGRTPFQADNYTALAHAHIYEPVPPPTLFNPRISLSAQAVMLRALAKDPSQRFRTATDLAAALEFASSGSMVGGNGPVSGLIAGEAQGVRQTTVLICTYCGTMSKPHMRFCRRCGQSLSGIEPRMVTATIPGQGRSGSFSKVGSWTQLCPTCQAPNAPVSKFCTKCGNRLPGTAVESGPVMLTCPACGTQNLPGRNFCTRCGHQLARS